MPLNLWDRFTSFVAFQGALENLKKETNSNFYMQDAKTLVSIAKLKPKRCACVPESLKYYYIKYRCVHGGSYKRRSKGLRNSSTQRIGCKAFISLSLSDDQQALYISAICLEHDHDTNGELPTFRQKRKTRGQQLRVKAKDLKDPKQNSLELNVPNTTEMMFSSAKDGSDFVLVETVLNPDNVDMAGDLYTVAFDCGVGVNQEPTDPNETQSEEPEVMQSQNVPQKQKLQSSSENNICKCGIGTFDLTKQDLMKMEVEEHYHRLEVLQLQNIYEAERIEKMRIFEAERMEKMRQLYDLKIRKAEQELYHSNTQE